MQLHESTFEYLNPTPEQKSRMGDARSAFRNLYNQLYHLLPPGKDTDHVWRAVRSAAMWANVAITRNDDGTPRIEP